MDWDLKKLYSPLQDGAGQDLRYESIYDQIKEARFEEDPSLSRGIWERDLKKADWGNVFKLCVRALEEKTKDLQIVVWLCEAACHLKNWKGLLDSFELIYNFCENCWDICYPLIDNSSIDLEYRIRILDWFLEKITECSLFMPIVQPNGIIQQSLDLASWLSALNFDSIIRRSGGKIQESENSQQMTLKRFRTIIKQANVNDLQQVQKLVVDIIKNAHILLTFLQNKCQGQEPSFKKLIDQLSDIEKICQFALEGRINTIDESNLANSNEIQEEKLTSIEDTLLFPISENEPPPPIQPQNQPLTNNEDVTISNREDAYKAIEDLANFLIEIDSQSPGPYLIKMVSSWNNKSLPDIMDDITAGTSEGHRILKMISEIVKRT